MTQITEITNNRTSKVINAILSLAPLIIGLSLIHFQIFWFAQGPIHAIDHETPLNPVYYFWNIIYPWNPLSLGSPSISIGLDIIYGTIAAVSFGNELVSQIIVLTLPPIVGYFGILVLTRKILKTSLIGSIFGAFFFAFSTPYLVWFSIPYMLGLALIPWFYFIGFRLVSLIFKPKISPKGILFYLSASTFLLTIIASVYIHVLPLFLALFGISCIFLLKNQLKISRKTFLWIVIAILFVSITVFVGYSKLIEIYVSISSPIRGFGTYDLAELESAWELATVENLIRLTRGESNNELFGLVEQSRLSYFIPVLVFGWLLIVSKKTITELFEKRIFRLNISIFVSIGIVITIGIFYRELIFSGNTLTENLLLSGMRRPERLLEVLAFLFSACIAFSITIFEYRLCSGAKQLGGWLRKKNRGNLWNAHNKRIIQVLLLSVLVVTQIFFFSFMYIGADHPAISINYVPKPKDFSEIEKFLHNDLIGTTDFKSDHRFMVAPLYQPLTNYLRYNHPNFFYYTAFSGSTEAIQFVSVTNDLMAKHDPAVIFPLEMASIKYIATVPSSFSQTELGNWRLRGIGNTFGPHLLGDINGYKSFLSELPLTKLDENDSVFVNNDAIPRVSVPTMLVESKGDLKDVIQALKPLNRMISLKNYVLKLNPTDSSGDSSFIISDFPNEKKITGKVSKLHENDIDYKFTTENKPISENSIIVWSENKKVQRNGELITMSGVISPDKSELSIWVVLPNTVLSDLPNIEVGLLAKNKTLDEINFQIIDQNGNVLPSEVEKQITEEKQNHYTITIFPTQKMPNILKILLTGKNGTEQKIAIENEIRFKLLETLQTQAGTQDEEIQRPIEFPLLVTSSDSAVFPERQENGTLTFSTILESQVIDKNSLIVWSEHHKINADKSHIKIEGIIEPEKDTNELSTWIKIPSTNIAGLSKLTLRLFLENKTLDELRISPIDKNAEPVSAKIEKKILDEKKNYFEITIVPTNSMPEWVRILVSGEYNSKQKVIFENKISFKSLNPPILPVSDLEQQTALPIEFPYLVTNHDRVILPHMMNNEQFLFSIGDSINTVRSSFITIQEEKLHTGWNKKSEKIEWISPIEINVDLQIGVDEEKNEIIIPLFLGNTFNKDWKVDVRTETTTVSKMEHFVGNGYGNLWLLTLINEEESNYEENISFKIYWDPFSYILYLLKNLSGFILLILPIPLFFIYKRDGKRSS